MTLETFWPALERCGQQSAAADWKLMAGDGWQRAPLRRTARFAESVLDPRMPARRLDVLDESTAAGPAFFVVDGDFRPRPDVAVTANDIAVWEVNYDKLAVMLGRGCGFVASEAKYGESCVHVGNVIARREETRPVFLHVPAGGFFDYQNLVLLIARLPPSVLLLTCSRWITAEVAAIALERDVRLDPVAERLKLPSSERGTVHARARKAASPGGKGPILDVQPGWTWEKLKITIDPRGTLTASYGRERHTHDFRKAARSKAARPTELLVTIACNSEWKNPPSHEHDHEADRQAFKRLVRELKRLLPIPGKPFEKRSGIYRPRFQLTLVGVDPERLRAMRERKRS